MNRAPCNAAPVSAITGCAGVTLPRLLFLAAHCWPRPGAGDAGPARTATAAERVKDLASVAGVRSNQLVGYGLVVGLDGTGDQTTQAPFTSQSLRNMLGQLGVTIPPGVNLQLRNVAAVMVHRRAAAVRQAGPDIDITVSSIGNAGSLRGGAADDAAARRRRRDLRHGAGQPGRRRLWRRRARRLAVSVNVPSVGRIPAGATVEREVPSFFNQGDSLVLNLNRADFTTARRLVEAINTNSAPTWPRRWMLCRCACARLDPDQRVSFVSVLENIRVTPGRAAGAGDRQRAHRHHRDGRRGAGACPPRCRTAA
jgi:flagellar P-ring protein FlgI